MDVTNIIDRIRLLFIAEKKPYLQLKEILGFYPHDIKYYKLALVHKSVAYYEQERLKEKRKKNKDDGEHKNSYTHTLRLNNERLEFLGDAMLSAIVADILYKHYAGKQEGFLTSLRSKIVCRKSLNKLAVDLGLDKLILHAGAVTTGHNSYMHGNAFEAFFGAIYIDRGYEYCYQFLEKKVFNHFIIIEKMAETEENYKSRFIEWCQRYKYRFAFEQESWRVLSEHGTPKFKSVATIEAVPCGEGEGYTKKEADQKAAKQALYRVKKDRDKALLIERIKEAQKQRLLENENKEND